MTDITTPVGRIVWGNPLNGRNKTDNNNNPVVGPDGKPVTQWAFGLALPKAECGELFAAMQQEANQVFPQGAPANFAWKFKDGDGVDQNGKPFNEREGYAGCIVISVSTEAFAPQVVREVGNGQFEQMLDGLKTGDYVRAALNIKAHAGKPNVRGSVPGIYINPVMIQFVGYGTEIRNGPDAATLFGGKPVQLPPGASPTPVASGPMPTGAPGQPQNVAGFQIAAPQGQSGNAGNAPGAAPGMPGAAPTPAPQPATASPTNPPQPAHDFVQNAAGPAMPGMPGGGQPGGQQ